MQTRRIGDREVSAIGLGGMPMSIEGGPDRERVDRHHPRRARRRRHPHRHRRRLPPARRRGRPQRGADRRGAGAPTAATPPTSSSPPRAATCAPATAAGRWTAARSISSEAVRGLAQAARRRRDRPLPVPPARPGGRRTRSPSARCATCSTRARSGWPASPTPTRDQIRQAQRDPRRPPGQRAEPVLAGVPVQRARAASSATSWASRSCRGARSAASRSAGELGDRFAAVPRGRRRARRQPAAGRPRLDARRSRRW